MGLVIHSFKKNAFFKKQLNCIHSTTVFYFKIIDFEMFVMYVMQVIVSDINTQFIEHTIYIMKSILDGRQNKDQNEQPSSEHLGITSIEAMMLGIVRYVRHLDMVVHAIHIKTKLCQLVEVMMKRRDDLAFRQEMKFRNKLVEYLTDWVMGTSHQIAPPSSGDVAIITR